MGGMGVVWEAIDADGLRVAMKILHPQVAADPATRARLDREASILARVRSPHVARILDIESEDESGYSFVVTELVQGPNLHSELEVYGAYDLANDAQDFADLAHGLVEALADIHSFGIVHRDLKPANIMLGPQGPVLIDFGIAQMADDVRLTQVGQVTGTPGYLPPEMLDGAQPSPSTDWYACAGVLLTTLTGRPPFGSGPWQAVLKRVYDGTPALGDLPERWPSMARILTAALRPDPEDRLEIGAVLEVLDEILQTGEDPDWYLDEDGVDAEQDARTEYIGVGGRAGAEEWMAWRDGAPTSSLDDAALLEAVQPAHPQGTDVDETDWSGAGLTEAAATVDLGTTDLAGSDETAYLGAQAAGCDAGVSPDAFPTAHIPGIRSRDGLPQSTMLMPPQPSTIPSQGYGDAPPGAYGFPQPGSAAPQAGIQGELSGDAVPGSAMPGSLSSVMHGGPRPALPGAPGAVYPSAYPGDGTGLSGQVSDAGSLGSASGLLPEWVTQPRMSRSFALAWWLVCAALGGLLNPLAALTTLAFVLFVCGIVGRLADGRRQRRLQRGGPGGGDTAYLWLGLPWAAIRSAVATAASELFALLVVGLLSLALGLLPSVTTGLLGLWGLEELSERGESIAALGQAALAVYLLWRSPWGWYSRIGAGYVARGVSGAFQRAHPQRFRNLRGLWLLIVGLVGVAPIMGELLQPEGSAVSLIQQLAELFGHA